jgi:hypothetical protein
MTTQSRALADGQSIGRFGKRAPGRAVSAFMAMALACACACMASAQAVKPEKPNGQRAGPPSPSDPPGAGAFNIQAARTAGNTDTDNNVWLDTPEQLIAPAGYIFRVADVSGFDVEDWWQDVRFKWTFGDPGYYKRWADNAAEHDSIPWDRVYNVGGNIRICRGPKLFDQNGNEVGTCVKEPLKGYRPSAGGTFLGYDRNIGYGPRTAHCFTEPGAYTVTCEARKRGGGPVTKTRTVTVLDPDVVFAGNKTYVVATDGNFAGKPAGAQEFLSLDQAMSAINSGANNKSRRLLLKRGQTFGNGRIDPNPDLAAFQLGAFGPASTPPTITSAVRCLSNTTQYSIWGVNIQGSYNPADPYTLVPGSGFEKLAHGWITLSDASIKGYYTNVSLARSTHGLVSADVYISDWRGYGVYGGNHGGTWAFMGLFSKQNQNAVVGEKEPNPGKEPEAFANFPPGASYVLGGGARINAPGGVVVYGLADMGTVGMNFNINSLKRANDADFVKNNIAIAYDSLRLGRAQSNLGPVYDEAVVDRLRVERGPFSHNLSGEKFRPRRFLVDKVYYVPSNTTGGSILSPHASGYVIRNTVAVRPDAYRALGNSGEWIGRRFHDYGGFDGPLMSEMGVDIYNNTLINLRSAMRDSWTGPALNQITNGDPGKNNGVQDGSPYSGWEYRPYKYVKIGNNVSVSTHPDDSGQNTDRLSDLDTTEIWRSGFPGIRWLYANAPLWTEFKHPDGTCCYYELKPGAPSKGAASTSHSNVNNIKGTGSRIAVDDFFGNLRGETTSRGAFD